MKISFLLAETDEICNYIPVVSAITNLTDLFLKFVFLFLSDSTIKSNAYFHRISNKEFTKIFLSIFLPVVGNLINLFRDYKYYKIQKENSEALPAQYAKSVQKFVSWGLTAANNNGGLDPFLASTRFFYESISSLLPAQPERPRIAMEIICGNRLGIKEDFLLRSRVQGEVFYSGS